MSAGISLRDLRFSYPGDTAGTGTRRGTGTRGNTSETFLEIPNLDILPGEIAVLIGENGCGKTTLLKLLAGLLTPTAGTITSQERPVLVHQRPYLFAQSVAANVAWPLRIRGVPRDEARRKVTAALEQLGLNHLSRRWAPFLSGGEKQRVAIARTLVLDPDVLLLDEPTSNIDTASIRVIEDVLRQRAAAGKTVLMSTHNLASAYRLATRLLPMATGRLQSPEVNVFRGNTFSVEDEHVGRFRINGGPEIFCPVSDEPCTTAVIAMDDVILSAGDVSTSARNHLHGPVIALEDAGNELVRVVVDVGVPIVSLVTRRSVEELALHSRLPVFVTFKASAVGLY